MTSDHWLCCDLAQAVEDALAHGTLPNLEGAEPTNAQDRDKALQVLSEHHDIPGVDDLIADLRLGI